MILNLLIKCTLNLIGLAGGYVKRSVVGFSIAHSGHDRESAARDGEGAGIGHGAITTERAARAGTEARAAGERLAALRAAFRCRRAAHHL